MSIRRLTDNKTIMDYLILDSDNNWLATCDEQDLTSEIDRLKGDTEAEELYIYKAELIKTIKNE